MFALTANTLSAGKFTVNAAAMPSAASRPLPSALTAGLSAPDMLRVNAARPSFRKLAAKETLFLQGDESRHVYLLLDGWAFRHQGLEDGRRQILDFALPGAVLGFPGAGRLAYGVETLTPCCVSVFTRQALFDLLQRVPALSVRFLELMAGAEARAFDHLTSVGRRTARERVAGLLLELLGRSRRADGLRTAAQMTLPLAQSHIGDALGLASETVCRVLSALRKEGIVTLSDRQLEVRDIARLALEAGCEDDGDEAQAASRRAC
jgi:CRP-like cAMP-binding protein